MDDRQFLIATVPHTGTTSLQSHFNVSTPLQEWEKPAPRVGHIFASDVPKLIGWEGRIITPKRDPLLTAISWHLRYVITGVTHSFLKTSNVLDFYTRLRDVVRARPVEFYNMNTVKVTNQNQSKSSAIKLYWLYDAKRIGEISRLMPETLAALREFDWAGIPTESWWR